jgi:hypothetical protein
MSDLVRAGTQALEAYIAAGDIERLNPDQRVSLYRAVCESLGLNPLTQPFQYLRLSGKTVLYATKSCTEQLRNIHSVSVVRMEKEVFGDILVVTVAVRDKTGREDIATGSVCLKGLGGENLSNAYMKAETKAKRRATLSICGLAVLDESETDSIAGAERRTVQEVHVEPEPAADEAARHIPDAEPSKPKRGKTKSEKQDEPKPLPPATEEHLVTPDADISVVPNASGRKVCRIDRRDAETLAVLDEKLAGMIEAILAFGGIARCTVTRSAAGKPIVTDVGEVRDA